jgi:hypothetical protein
MPSFKVVFVRRFRFTAVFFQESNGLWQAIAFDIDGDGDQDYLGNWGMNSKFKASTNFQ